MQTIIMSQLPAIDENETNPSQVTKARFQLPRRVDEAAVRGLIATVTAR